MSRLEKGLHEHFANLQQAQSQATDTSSSTSQAAATSTSPAGIVETPFAKVNSVVSGSPAEQAGLKAGDTIRNFGGANWINHERLSKVAQIVQQHEGVSFHLRVPETVFRLRLLTSAQLPLVVKAVRKAESGPETTELTLRLTPRRDWGGRGLLGCHLVPL